VSLNMHERRFLLPLLEGQRDSLEKAMKNGGGNIAKVELSYIKTMLHKVERKCPRCGQAIH
jgi:hypothetical protein